MIFQCAVILVISLFASHTFCEEFLGHLLSRKRRYVTFPEGSSLGVQSVLSKPLLDYSFPSNWNWNVEYTVSFKLPNSTRQRLEQQFRPYLRHAEAHRRERRHVYQQLEAILDLNGVNGRACLLRTMCESKFHLSPGKSLWQDLLHVIFRFPEGPDEGSGADLYDQATSHQDCEPWTSSCPVSFLGFILASAASLPSTDLELPFPSV